MSARFPFSAETLSTHLRRVQDAIAKAFFIPKHGKEYFRVQVESVEDISAGFPEIMVSLKIRVPDKSAPSEFPNLQAVSPVLARVSASSLNAQLFSQGLPEVLEISGVRMCGNETVETSTTTPSGTSTTTPSGTSTTTPSVTTTPAPATGLA